MTPTTSTACYGACQRCGKPCLSVEAYDAACEVADLRRTNEALSAALAGKEERARAAEKALAASEAFAKTWEDLARAEDANRRAAETEAARLREALANLIECARECNRRVNHEENIIILGGAIERATVFLAQPTETP